MDYKIIKNKEELLIEYKSIFINEIEAGDFVLYVGIECDDIIFYLLEEVTKNIVIVEKKKTISKYNNYSNYCFINDDILNIYEYLDGTKFDIAIISFTLHENIHESRLKIINILKSICNKIILIEPLKRNYKYGILFESLLVKYNKFYESLNYWESIFPNNKEIILQRNQYAKIKLKNRNIKYVFNIKLQDIAVFIWRL